jgi:hypothetical protein
MRPGSQLGERRGNRHGHRRRIEQYKLKEETYMHTHSNLRRLAGIAAVAVVSGAGVAFAAPADAATGPTATLSNGVVTVTGTTVRDVVSITIDASQLTVDFGADGTVDAHFPRLRFSSLKVLAGGGDDGVGVTGTGYVPVTVSGGAGNDGIGVVGNIGGTGEGDAPTTITGDGGNDGIFAATPGPVTIEGGAGDDRVDGGGAGIGQETVSLGDGNDRFVSSLNTFIGARSDIVDGGTGTDSLEMDGTFASESVSLSASAGHLVVNDDRSALNVHNLENVSYVGFGGLDEGSGDSVVVNDLSGTGVVNFTPNFSANQDSTAGDNSADQLTVRGTNAVDNITVSGSGAHITVAGLTPTVTPVFMQRDDVLRIDTLDGKDSVVSSGLQPGLVQLLVS